MASRSSADKLKPLPPDPDRHQHSAIPPPLRVSFFLDRNPLFFRGDTGDKGDCKGERTFRVGPGEETGGDRLIRGLVSVSPVTPACPPLDPEIALVVSLVPPVSRPERRLPSELVTL